MDLLFYYCYEPSEFALRTLQSPTNPLHPMYSQSPLTPESLLNYFSWLSTMSSSFVALIAPAQILQLHLRIWSAEWTKLPKPYARYFHAVTMSKLSLSQIIILNFKTDKTLGSLFWLSDISWTVPCCLLPSQNKIQIKIMPGLRAWNGHSPALPPGSILCQGAKLSGV